jgi:hypothetical protein
MDEPFKQVQFRMYHHYELPALLGIPKSTLNRDLKPFREKLGPRMGNRWTFEQVIKILKIFAIPYIVVQ